MCIPTAALGILHIVCIIVRIGIVRIVRIVCIIYIICILFVILTVRLTLEYVGTTWANTISSDSGNIELVSPVTENNQQALNLSAILNKTYSQNETIATVTFKAKNAYTTMPVTLTLGSALGL